MCVRSKMYKHVKTCWGGQTHSDPENGSGSKVWDPLILAGPQLQRTDLNANHNHISMHRYNVATMDSNKISTFHSGASSTAFHCGEDTCQAASLTQVFGDVKIRALSTLLPSWQSLKSYQSKVTTTFTKCCCVRRAC